MTCDPNEHKFVTKTSYSVSMETESAVVEDGSEEKRCKKCGKTPSELDDFVTPASNADQPAEQNTGADGNIETSDDAVIMQTDNSEAQAQHAHEPPATHKQDDSSSTETDESLYSGDQDDDAYIMGGAKVSDESNDADSDDAVSSGPFLVCPVCQYKKAASQTPEYPGDSCPECRQAYLEKKNE